MTRVLQHLGKAYDESTGADTKRIGDLIIRMVDSTPQNTLTIQEFRTLVNNERIGCITQLRNRTGLTLTDAKLIVDEFERILKMSYNV